MNAIMMKMAADEAKADAEAAKESKARRARAVVSAGLKGALIGDVAHTVASQRSLSRAFRKGSDDVSQFRKDLNSKGLETHRGWTNSRISHGRALAINHGGKIIGATIGAGRELLKQRKENKR